MKPSLLLLVAATWLSTGCWSNPFAPKGSFSQGERFPAMQSNNGYGQNPYGNGHIQGQPVQPGYGQVPGQGHVQGAQAQQHPYVTQPNTNGAQGAAPYGVEPSNPQVGAQVGDPTRPVDPWSPTGAKPKEMIDPSNPVHGLEGDPGRLQILDLYQRVLDERNLLSDEVEQLRAELQTRDAAIAQADQGSTGLMSEIAALKSERNQLQAEVQDLLGRLTTAQIRRLEAEKLVLESRIQDYSEERMNEQGAPASKRRQ